MRLQYQLQQITAKTRQDSGTKKFLCAANPAFITGSSLNFIVNS